MAESKPHQRAVFFALTLIYAAALSLRHVPGLLDSNDTGRYVAEFWKWCQQPLSAWADVGIAWRIYDLLATPACWFGDERAYMLIAALPIPLAFLLFGDWRTAGLVWALASIASIHGFELMTNALRQGAGIFLLLWAFALKGISWRLLGLLSIASLLHVSGAIYAPLVLLLALMKSPRRPSRAVVVGAIGMVLVMAAIAIFFEEESISGVMRLFEAYQSIYAEKLSPSFLVFMVFPVYWIYLVRMLATHGQTSRSERAAVLYASALLSVSTLAAPFIAFRLAIVAGVVQLFISMKESQSSAAEGMAVFTGLAVQLAFFVGYSDYAQRALFG